jgi:hypothetical protein
MFFRLKKSANAALHFEKKSTALNDINALQTQRRVYCSSPAWAWGVLSSGPTAPRERAVALGFHQEKPQCQRTRTIRPQSTRWVLRSGFSDSTWLAQLSS